MRLLAVLSLLLALPTPVHAAPKKKAVATGASAAEDMPKKKAVQNPCPDVVFTPAPLVIEGLYESDLKLGTPAVTYSISAGGHGVVIRGAMYTGSAGPDKLRSSYFKRLETIPTSASCTAADGQSMSGVIDIGTELATPDLSLAAHVSDARCQAGVPWQCELRFAPITIAMTPKQAGVCKPDGVVLYTQKTVIARRAGTAPSGSSPSIRFTHEPRAVGSGVEYLGVLTAVPDRGKGRKAARPLYRGTFSLESGVNASTIRTLYPGCVPAEAAVADGEWSFVPTTSDTDVLMGSPVGGWSPNTTAKAVCAWHGATERVLACNVELFTSMIPVVDDLI